MRALAIMTCAVLAGCSSPEPTLYTLSPVPGTPRPGGARTVVLRDVSVAKYLDRDHIVRSSEGNRVSLEGNDWWAEPLPGMIGRVLVSELGQRLPGSGVFAASGAISPGPDSHVSVNILRLDADPAGRIVLDAQVAVDRPTLTRDVHLTVPVTAAGVRAEVSAMSVALGQLADATAALLRP